MSNTTLINLERAVLQKGGLKKFIELSWHQIEPGKTFVLGWHIDAICEHLPAISRGERIVSTLQGENFMMSDSWH